MKYNVIELSIVGKEDSLQEFNFQKEEKRNAVFNEMVEKFENKDAEDDLKVVMASTANFSKVKHIGDTPPKEERIYKFFSLKDYVDLENFLVKKSKE